jgi:hypothetical protein
MAAEGELNLIDAWKNEGELAKAFSWADAQPHNQKKLTFSAT